MENFIRTEALIGRENMKKLKRAHVVLCGCGGVGSYTLEALVRSGIGKVTVIDNDTVAKSNINRQLIATCNTVGMPKTAVAKERMLSINPDVDFIEISQLLNRDNIAQILPPDADFIADAIDCVPAKVGLALFANERNIPIISCLGTGNRLDCTKFEICDIYSTSGCPLARKMRYELKKIGIEKLDVLFSKAAVTDVRQAFSDGKRTVGSVAFVPSVAGLIMAQHIVLKIIGEE